MTSEDIRSRLSDRTAACGTLYGEARGEPLAGQLGVLWVIRNRVMHPAWWGTSWRSVCLTPWQFSCWWERSPNTDETYAFAERLLTEPPQGAEESHRTELLALVDQVRGGVGVDPTGGANHYVTTALWLSGTVKMLQGQTPLCTLGHQTFFKFA